MLSFAPEAADHKIDNKTQRIATARDEYTMGDDNPFSDPSLQAADSTRQQEELPSQKASKKGKRK